MQHHKASITAIMGGTGCGKSRFFKEQLAKEKINRMIIWDYAGRAITKGRYDHAAGEYQDFVDFSTHDYVALIKYLEKHGSGNFRVAFKPCRNDKKTRETQFSDICGLVQGLGDLTFVVEELRFVTSPTWAPERWSSLTCMGRHSGLQIVGFSQRPASIDKDFLGNCTQIICFRMTYSEDADKVAKSMKEPLERVESLAEHQCLHKDMNSKVCREIQMPW